MKDYLDSDDAKNLVAAAKRETQDFQRSQMSDEPGATETLRTAAERMGASKPESRTSGAPKNFGQAFAAARKAGDKTFMFNGKKYTTELKEEAAKKPAPTKPKAEPPKATPAAAKAETKPAETDTTTKRLTPREKLQKLTRALRVPERSSYKSGGMVSASKRADGCAVRGKTRGKMV